jgi:hypothetical protein
VTVCGQDSSSVGAVSPRETAISDQRPGCSVQRREAVPSPPVSTIHRSEPVGSAACVTTAVASCVASALGAGSVASVVAAGSAVGSVPAGGSPVTVASVCQSDRPVTRA